MLMIRLTMITMLALSLLMACSNTNNNEVIDEPIENDQIAESDDQDSTTDYYNEEMHPDQDQIVSQMERLPFTEFELEVTYDNDIEYESELERKSNGHYKVKLEDEINGVKLQGIEAFDQLYPFMKDLTITEESNKDEVIEDILSTFNLDDNYNQFNLEIKFNDGFEYEFKDKK